MILLRFLFKLVAVMNSETSARSLAAAFALGVFLGLVPLGSLQAWGVLAIVLFLRVNLSLALAATLCAKLAGAGLDPTFHRIGTALLEREGLYGLWSAVTNQPVLSLAHLGHTVVLGRTAVAVAVFLPAWGVGVLLVRLYRRRIEPRLRESRVVAFLRSQRVYSLYRAVTSPFGR